MSNDFSRRDFLAMSARGAGAAVLSYGLMGCTIDEGDLIPSTFTHGVASGDPSHDALIIWTRITPKSDGEVKSGNESGSIQAAGEIKTNSEINPDGEIKVSWEVATDSEFTQLITTGEMLTNQSRDYTVKIDALGLTAGTQYFYRFKTGEELSPVGTGKTLPEGAVDSVKFAVLSCANFPAGYFNVYELAAQQTDLDAVIHLGDYIYEYGRGGYASEKAKLLDREVLPEGELVSLSDYRIRYGQYRTDASLSKLHAQVPFITVWDDHEIANDTWRDGAENHSEEQGDFNTRKQAALQAYFEWLPIRPWREASVGENITSENSQAIYRSFSYGDLVDLHMLDTRVLGRDKQLDYADYFSVNGLDYDALMADIHNEDRTMLGADQLQWLQDKLQLSTAKWQVLGQQVLMTQIELPGAIVSQKLNFPEFVELIKIAKLVARVAHEDPTLTTEELDYLAAIKHKLTEEKRALLQLETIPYNLDAWDGYAHERNIILETAQQANQNLVVIAGDTHNSWASELKTDNGETVGVEFATSSVSSPGIEYYLKLPEQAIQDVEGLIVNLVDDLQYANIKDRGFMTLTFTPEQVNTQWQYVSTIMFEQFHENSERSYSMVTPAVW
jgi:alkaline phosphatase D